MALTFVYSKAPNEYDFTSAWQLINFFVFMWITSNGFFLLVAKRALTTPSGLKTSVTCGVFFRFVSGYYLPLGSTSVLVHRIFLTILRTPPCWCIKCISAKLCHCICLSVTVRNGRVKLFVVLWQFGVRLWFCTYLPWTPLMFRTGK